MAKNKQEFSFLFLVSRRSINVRDVSKHAPGRSSTRRDKLRKVCTLKSFPAVLVSSFLLATLSFFRDNSSADDIQRIDTKSREKLENKWGRKNERCKIAVVC